MKHPIQNCLMLIVWPDVATVKSNFKGTFRSRPATFISMAVSLVSTFQIYTLLSRISPLLKNPLLSLSYL
jgi:hypothetical protein